MSFKVGASVISPATELTEGFVAHYLMYYWIACSQSRMINENLEGYASADQISIWVLITLRLSRGSTVYGSGLYMLGSSLLDS